MKTVPKRVATQRDSARREPRRLPGLPPAAALVLAVLLGGCQIRDPNAPVVVYDGPARASGEVAVVECGFSARILAIDGNGDFRGQAMKDRFALLPGKHRFTVTLAPETVGEPAATHRVRTVTFRLEAGHVYDISVFNQSVDGRPWGIVVTDRTTNDDLINPYRTL